MRRREFIEVAASALAAGALVGCTSREARDDASSPVAGARKPMNAAAFHAARQFAETPFGRIAYVERGTGDAALFLHGFPLNGFQWRGALDRLSAHRRCVAPDFLAMGYTEVAEGQSVAPEAQAAMLVALLDSLSIPSVDLVANDSGGTVAQLFVTQHPERVRTLLLTNCDAENDSPPPALLPVIEPALKRSTVPTRIVWGTGDTIFSPASPDYLDRTFGSSRGVRRVEGAKLFFPEEFPDLIAEEARGLWGVG